MSSINKYGINMIGLKKASGETAKWPENCGGYTQISYDTRDGRILTTDHIGQSFTQYEDREIIHVANTERRMTMQEIADAVRVALYQHKAAL